MLYVRIHLNTFNDKFMLNVEVFCGNRNSNHSVGTRRYTILSHPVLSYCLCQLPTQVVLGCLNCLCINCYITCISTMDGDQYRHCGLHLQCFLSMNAGFVFAIFFDNLFMLLFLSVSISLLSLFSVCNPYKLQYKSLHKSSTRCGGK